MARPDRRRRIHVHVTRHALERWRERTHAGEAALLHQLRGALSAPGIRLTANGDGAFALRSGHMDLILSPSIEGWTLITVLPAERG